jgi:hypothetical protein
MKSREKILTGWQRAGNGLDQRANFTLFNGLEIQRAGNGLVLVAVIHRL